MEHEHQWVPYYEDDVLLGSVYFGEVQCEECLAIKEDENYLPSPIALGVYK